jgi:hypothetical protein
MAKGKGSKLPMLIGVGLAAFVVFWLGPHMGWW